MIKAIIFDIGSVVITITDELFKDTATKRILQSFLKFFGVDEYAEFAKAAEKIGMHSLTFISAEQLKKDLRKLNIKI